MRAISIGGLLKRWWIPLLLIVVLSVSGLAVTRLHKVFGSQDLNANSGAGIKIVQFNPKVVKYEIFGPPGSTANINYWDADANTHQLNDVPLPWSFTRVHHAAHGEREHHGADRRRPHRLPHHRRRRVARAPEFRRPQRPDLLPGEVRMSNHEAATTAETDSQARTARSSHTPSGSSRSRSSSAGSSLTVIVNVAVPTLEVVGEAHSAPMAPLDAPSMKAMMRMGHNFHEFDSNSTVMVVVESQKPLGDAAHHYYDDIVRKLRKDTKHVQHIQDFWGDRFTAAGAQSADAKGSYVQVNIAGNQGTTQANNSVEAVRKVVDEEHAPPGVKAYVTGPAALSDDMHVIGNDSLAKITLFTLGAIAIMLLLVYRSIVTTLIQLFMTFVALACARGIVAVLGYNNAFGLTTFAANILTMLAIAAGTDYGIFLVGRYQEARREGEDRETAYYTTFKGVAPVVLGSGLTIAGATYCLSFCRLPWFSTMGAPVAIGMLVVVAAGLTLGPAVVFLGSRFGLFEKKSQARGKLWRRVGTAVVRWPAPIFAVSLAAVLVGMVALPGFKTSYNDRHYLPETAPSNVGYAAADRHFSEARMNPDLLMIEADHDMRNTSDMLVLDKVAKNEIRTVGIAMIQDITRPLGIPIQHSSIPFQNSIQSQTTMQNMKFLKDRMADILKMADEMQIMIDVTTRQAKVTHDLATAALDSAKTTQETSEITDTLRDHIADFEDFYRPIRSYFYWEKHCYDIPVCISFRSLFDSIDGFDQLAEKFHELSGDIARTAAGLARVGAADPDHARDVEDDAWSDADHVPDVQGDDRPDGGDE